MSFQDHFSTQASVYARARPLYPPALFGALARLAPGRGLAWDCGAGNGQASLGLADHFDRVVATEPSASQRAQAPAHPRVCFVAGSETAPHLEPESVDLVTAAQAAHWFDRPAFYSEAARVLRPGGVVALWTYGVCEIEPGIDALTGGFYSGTVGPYWPPERRHVEDGYRGFEFPFEEMPFPALSMEHDWVLEEFAAYVRSWSAVARHSRDHGGEDPVAALERALGPLWGPGCRRVTWPLSGRIGRKTHRPPYGTGP